MTKESKGLLNPCEIKITCQNLHAGNILLRKTAIKSAPLVIQSGNDKLVQEVVKMILESIYEPVFKKTSHGFRPNKSCLTALYQIQKTFTGTNWFVEGDIHACLDSSNHHTII